MHWWGGELFKLFMASHGVCAICYNKHVARLFSLLFACSLCSLSLSLSLPFSLPFAHPVNLSNNLLRLLRVPLFHRRPGRRRRRRFAAVTMPTHHMMIYSCPPGLSCRLRSVGRSVACFFSLHISSIYVHIFFNKKFNFAALFAFQLSFSF